MLDPDACAARIEIDRAELRSAGFIVFAGTVEPGRRTVLKRDAYGQDIAVSA